MSKQLTVDLLCQEAKTFSETESEHWEATLFGVTDGTAVGTYFEHKFLNYLSNRYIWERGNSARGIDLPGLSVDIKVTSIKQPQSSCPFKSARQKIYGLGYSLLVFVYEKEDNQQMEKGRLRILHTVYVDQGRTGDYQTTTGILRIIENNGNVDDLTAFIEDRYLPVDETERYSIAEELLENPPEVGYLTISNALQWRLQYRRIIEEAGGVQGIVKVW